MPSTHYVIVGNGTAGNRAADVLRKGDPESRVTIVSAEPTPYLRRRRLPRYLVGEGVRLEDLDIHEPEWYAERDIKLRLNQPVVSLHDSEKYALLAHRERLHYDKLLICTGSRHRLPEYLSPYDSLLTRFGSGLDAIKLRNRLPKMEHLTMIGGDCVALQLCMALLGMGKKITMILNQYRFWPLEFDEDVKDRIAAAIEKKGIEIVRGDFPTEIAGEGEELTIKTRQGKVIETNAAVLTSGMVPCLEFLAGSGVDVQEGVLVNERLESSVKDVYAAGECAQIYYGEIGEYRCSTGFVNASNQGKMAARNMLGEQETVSMCEPGHVVIEGEKFVTYGWKGFSLDEKG